MPQDPESHWVTRGVIAWLRVPRWVKGLATIGAVSLVLNVALVTALLGTRRVVPRVLRGGASGVCAQKPDATNVGATGSLPASGVTTLSSGQTLENVTVSSLTVSGSNITIRNVVSGGISIDTASNVTVDHVTSLSNSIVDAQNVSFTNSKFGGDNTSDEMFISPWVGTVEDVTITGNYFSRPTLPAGTDVHFDATQVRGIDGLLLQCNNYELGPYQDGYNVSIYLERGWDLSNVTVDNNWIDGGAFAVAVGQHTPPSSLQLTNNKVLTANLLFNLCSLSNAFTQADLDAMTQTGNTVNGTPAQLCKSSDLVGG